MSEKVKPPEDSGSVASHCYDADEFWTIDGIEDPAECVMRRITQVIAAGCVRLLDMSMDRPISTSMVVRVMRDSSLPILEAWSQLQKYKHGACAEYLASDQWKSLRNSVICRDQCVCVRCGSTERLEVHHKTYSRRGFEKMDDLETLCRVCHERHHGLSS
jgi:hypothetical protein